VRADIVLAWSHHPTEGITVSSDVIESKVRSADGTSIAYDRRGEGPPLVLVGGAFQYRAFDPRTAALADRLAQRFTVLVYDRRGRGESGEQLPYAREREVEDLAAVLDDAGAEASVFGMSSGGALALDAALAGVGMERLALYEPPFIVDDRRPPLPDEYVERLTALCAEGRPGDAVEYFLTTAAMVPPEMVAGMREAPMWPGFEAVAHTLAYDGAFVQDVSRGDARALQRWAPVAVPTLVAVGGDSPPHVHSAAVALASVLPRGETRTLPGQTHDVAADALAPVLEELLPAERVGP
jgi:pimeloyl-ACP methyl ester carboxylesterase